MDPHPVTFSVARPPRYARIQLLVRVGVFILLSLIGGEVVVGGAHVVGWGLPNVLYLGLPIFAAVRVSQLGGEGYLARDGGWLTRALRWLVELSAFLALLTDQFPLDQPERPVRFEIHASAKPEVGRALWRLLTVLPAALLLFVMGLLGAFTWTFAAIAILIDETCPQILFDYHAAVVRWQGRTFAYHASLVDTYPSFD